MEHKFWHKKWEKNEIGFHLDSYNPILTKHWIDFKSNFSKLGSVLIPLCGKSKDILFFSDMGLKVTGVELSEDAIIAFFKENNLAYNVSIVNNSKLYSCLEKDIQIFNCDILTLSHKDLGKVEMIYDRASIVALPQKIRTDYVKWIHEIKNNETKVFMNVFEFDAPNGPPFSITLSDIKNYFSDSFTVTLIESIDIEAHKIQIHKNDISWLKSQIYFLL